MKLFNKKDVLTIPNFLTLFRFIILVPLIYFYVIKNNASATVSLILLSGLSDIADGVIARKFNMVSDLGKILDPLADKMTLGVLIFCSCFRNRHMIVLFVLFVLREFIMALMGYVTMKRVERVNSAEWYGKANTVVLYMIVLSMVIFPDMSGEVSDILALAGIISVLASLLLYLRFYSNFIGREIRTLTTGKKFGKWMRIAGYGLWAAAAVVCIINRDKISLENLTALFRNNAVSAFMILMLLYALKSFTVVLHCGILFAVAGIVFPLPLAIIINITGCAVMVTVPYYIGRADAKLSEMSEDEKERKDKNGKAEKALKTIKNISEKTKGNPFMTSMILRMIGVIPGDLISFALGRSGCAYLPYLLGSICGLLSKTVTFAIMGTEIGDITSPAFLICAGFEITAAAATIIISKIISAKKNDVKPDENGGSDK
ncbi:MAG: CDP-alcohol phosphatidyltransferase family protein [Clostridia bacterium]|nr:CDP-alcohol phosphatidyltransferase family protein [Clostridia bacterium]